MWFNTTINILWLFEEKKSAFFLLLVVELWREEGEQGDKVSIIFAFYGGF